MFLGNEKESPKSKPIGPETKEPFNSKGPLPYLLLASGAMDGSIMLPARQNVTVSSQDQVEFAEIKTHYPYQKFERKMSELFKIHIPIGVMTGAPQPPRVGGRALFESHIPTTVNTRGPQLPRAAGRSLLRPNIPDSMTAGVPQPPGSRTPTDIFSDYDRYTLI